MPEDIIINLAAELFKSLAHPVRAKILYVLKNGEKCVCELIEEIEVEQSNLSQHLGLMKKQGVIISRKDGQKVIYSIAYDAVLELLEAAEKVIAEQVNHSQSILKYLKKDVSVNDTGIC